MQSFSGPVLPSRGKAGESRLRPADTKRTKSRVRNSDRGLRSADSTARRAGKWKMLRRLSRQLYRNKTLLATVLIPPTGGQDSIPRSQEHNFRNPNHRKEKKKKARQLAKMSLYIDEKDWKKSREKTSKTPSGATKIENSKKHKNWRKADSKNNKKQKTQTRKKRKKKKSYLEVGYTREIGYWKTKSYGYQKRYPQKKSAKKITRIAKKTMETTEKTKSQNGCKSLKEIDNADFLAPNSDPARLI